MRDPTSRQRGRPTETRQQLSDNTLRTESNIYSQVSEWARYLDILTNVTLTLGARGSIVFGALGYKLKGRGFEIRSGK
jgi:hypothetical protein